MARLVIKNNGKPNLLGKYVYLTLPPQEKSKLIVDENTKEALSKEMMMKMRKLEVWCVGSAANPDLVVGQSVLVNPASLQKALMVPFDIDGEEVIKALVLDYDIVHIW